MSAQYVTIQMIADAAKKHTVTVGRALDSAGATKEKFPGVKGHRVKRSDAEKFLARQWPGASL